MSFFRKIKAVTHQTTNYIQSKPSLQAVMYKARLFHILKKKFKSAILTTGKRMSSFISPANKGSMTVEAALCLPLFMGAILTLISCLKIIDFQSHMDAALTETGNHMAIYSYNNDTLGTLYAKVKTESFLGKEYIENSLVCGGSSGIWYGDSEVEEDTIFLQTDYLVEPVFNILGLSKMKFSNHFYGHTWTGYDINGSAGQGEEIVYITEYGAVYHRNRKCSYLTLSVRTIPVSGLEAARNTKGSRYRACDYCKNEECGAVVYIADDGDSYHKTRGCKGLQRTVYSIKEKELFGRVACSRCSAGGDG